MTAHSPIEPPESAFVVGSVPKGEDRIREFVDKARDARWNPTRLANLDAVKTHLSRANCPRPLALLYLRSREEVSPWEAVRQLEALGVKVIVFLNQCTVAVALKCIAAGAIDVIRGDETGADTTILANRVTLLESREFFYPMIEWHGPQSIFLVSPWNDALWQQFAPAAIAGLRQAGFTVFTGRESLGSLSMTVFDKVTKKIAELGGVISNLSLEAASDPRRSNPNVYFETGYAMGKGKPAILVRNVKDRPQPLPADIQGLIYVEFTGEVDLAMRLYWGLKQGLAKNGSP